MPEHDAPPPAASRAGLWSSLGGAIFIAAVLSLLGGPKNGGPVWRWLGVMGYSAALAGVLRFGRQAWQGWDEDKVPATLACVMSAAIAADAWAMLIGRRGAALHGALGYVPFRWVEYSGWESAALAALSMGLGVSALWLVRSIGHYLNRKNRAAAVVVAAASVALSGIVWAIVN